MVDLKANPPGLAAILAVVKQRSGLNISPNGNLAPIVNGGDN